MCSAWDFFQVTQSHANDWVKSKVYDVMFACENYSVGPSFTLTRDTQSALKKLFADFLPFPLIFILWVAEPYQRMLWNRTARNRARRNWNNEMERINVLCSLLFCCALTSYADIGNAISCLSLSFVLFLMTANENEPENPETALQNIYCVFLDMMVLMGTPNP